jgi:nicotinamidase-related amidase
MTTLADRPNTALLVIDVQEGVVGGAHERDAVVANIGELVARARADGVPVVWVAHSDEDMPRGGADWQYVAELVRREPEPLVHKSFCDSFEGTDLEQVLAAAGAGRLVVTGAETDVCIRATIHGGFARGYDVTLVSDAHTCGDKTAWGAPPVPQVIAHTNLYWRFQGGPGKKAAVVETKEVSFS